MGDGFVVSFFCFRSETSSVETDSGTGIGVALRCRRRLEEGGGREDRDLVSQLRVLVIVYPLAEYLQTKEF